MEEVRGSIPLGSTKSPSVHAEGLFTFSDQGKRLSGSVVFHYYVGNTIPVGYLPRDAVVGSSLSAPRA